MPSILPLERQSNKVTLKGNFLWACKIWKPQLELNERFHCWCRCPEGQKCLLKARKIHNLVMAEYTHAAALSTINFSISSLR